jgi:hypothetical protein
MLQAQGLPTVPSSSISLSLFVSHFRSLPPPLSLSFIPSLCEHMCAPVCMCVSFGHLQHANRTVSTRIEACPCSIHLAGNLKGGTQAACQAHIARAPRAGRDPKSHISIHARCSASQGTRTPTVLPANENSCQNEPCTDSASAYQMNTPSGFVRQNVPVQPLHFTFPPA